MGKASESAIHWTIAAALAALIAFMFVRTHTLSDSPCNEQRCIADIESRLAAIEAEMRTRTLDRYTGSDAKRDLLIINQRIDRLHTRIEEAHK